jgi:hypothetical protein
MKTIVRNSAGVALVFPVTIALLAGCGHRSPRPEASASGTPAATAMPNPTTSGSASAPGPSTASTPGTRVIASLVAYQWRWPNNADKPGLVPHAAAVPVPELVRINVGSHPGEPGQPPFDRMSFTFTNAFPSYRFAFTDQLTGDPSGQVIPVKGLDILRIVFTGAQAHAADGTRSTIISQPVRDIGYRRMVDYALGGDFEGVLTYGIGINWPIPKSNPQIPVRAYEIQTVMASGQHRYVVAIDINSANGG